MKIVPIILAAFFSIAIAVQAAGEQPPVDVIPQPQQMERTKGAFKLTPDVVIATDANSQNQTNENKSQNYV